MQSHFTVAILGTTVSPYLFFWHITMEEEYVKHFHYNKPYFLEKGLRNGLTNFDKSIWELQRFLLL